MAIPLVLTMVAAGLLGAPEETGNPPAPTADDRGPGPSAATPAESGRQRR